MSIPSGVTKVVLQGHLTGAEIFETGFWLKGAAPISDAAASVLAAQLATFFGTDLKPSVVPLITTTSGYDNLRVYGYPTGGPTAVSVGVAAIASGAGTGTGQSNPNQVSIVATLRTALAGRRNRGRMYLPANAANIISGQLSSAQCTSLATAVAAFFTDINSNAAGPQKVQVVSITGSVSNDVTDVSVDSKLDIQRRRANRQAATSFATHAV